MPASQIPGKGFTPVVGAVLRAAGRAIRDLWLILGISLLLALSLEGLYRAQARIRNGSPPMRRVVDSTLHPYAGEAWWGPFQGREGHGVRDNRYDAYRGFAPRPARSLYMNIDSAGRRVTPQAIPIGGGSLLQIVMLGGSTMWGYAARDSFTIPAHLARELRARGRTDVEVVNLAQVGYNSTQDVITLLLEVAHGRVPAAVVTLEGYNDVTTAVEYGGAGHTYSERAAAVLLERGRGPAWAVFRDLGAGSGLIQALRRKLGFKQPPTKGPPPAPEVLCSEVAQYFHAIAQASTGIGRSVGFPVLVLLQPFHGTSRKPPSPWEKTFRSQPVYVQCLHAIEAEMARDPGAARFRSLKGIFDSTRTTVFADEYSHLTETANQQVAAWIADELLPLLPAPGGAAAGQARSRRDPSPRSATAAAATAPAPRR